LTLKSARLKPMTGRTVRPYSIQGGR